MGCNGCGGNGSASRVIDGGTDRLTLFQPEPAAAFPTGPATPEATTFPATTLALPFGLTLEQAIIIGLVLLLILK